MLISRIALKAASAATSDDRSRYALNSVRVSPEGMTLATNGHLLVTARDKTPMKDAEFPNIESAPFHGTPETAVLIPSDIVKRLIDGMPKKSRLPVLDTVQVSRNGSPTTITLASTDLAVPTVATINTADSGNFPSVDSILANANTARENAISVIFKVEMLEHLIKVAKATGAKNDSITFRIPTADSNIDKSETGERYVTGAVPFDVSTHADVAISGVAMPARR